MNILVVGGGGREHALCWKLRQSPLANRIHCAPGNAGIAEIATLGDVAADDVNGLLAYAKTHDIDFTVVGPEAALCEGVVDRFRADGRAIFGPTRAAAELEGSKAFAKELMARHSIPTAAFRVFDEPGPALRYIDGVLGWPIVIKASGLASGKGVVIARDAEEARSAVTRCMVERVFGRAGDRVVIEDRLEGEEVSILALTDGSAIAPLAPAQDHKRLRDGDEGPNTGGMGAYSPAPVATEAFLRQVERDILVLTVHAMQRERRRFTGMLYAGLMATRNGPRVLEYNVRFGDPETQAILPRLRSDLLPLLLACAKGKLDDQVIEWDPRPAVTVVLASEGYPGPCAKGRPIRGLAEAAALPDVAVFHAGTARAGTDVVTAGGRVLSVTALGDDFASARARAYEAVDLITFDGRIYRKDIGSRALERARSASSKV